MTGIGVNVTGVHKRFATRHALRGVDLEIRPGGFTAIVGRSGCGKSTLLRLVAGLEMPTDGNIAFSGSELDPRRDLRFMFQDARLLPWRSVAANVAVGLPGGRADPAAVHDLLDLVGLAGRGDEWPAGLSGGERQRVALARALAGRPRLLLLDEPMSALDALTRLDMQRLVERLWQAQGFTAILVTHDAAEAVALADDVILLDGGTVASRTSIDLPRPRRRAQPGFAQAEDAILERILGLGAGPSTDAPARQGAAS